MRSLRLCGRRLLGAFGRGRQDDEIDEELRAHRDMLAAQDPKSGMNTDPRPSGRRQPRSGRSHLRPTTTVHSAGCRG